MKTINYMIVEKFGSLPPSIEFEGVNFELQLINNGRVDDTRLCYQINCVSESSPHKELFQRTGSWHNPFDGRRLQGFLWLAQGIDTDQELLQAMERAEAFLKKNGLFIV